MPRVFRCARTGVLFPADYVEEWGRTYGIGLGPVPISEALVNQYHIPIAESRDSRKTMHPVGVSRAQVDLVDVSDEEWSEKRGIPAIADPDMVSRGQLMRTKQLRKSRTMQRYFPEESAAELKKQSPPPGESTETVIL